MKELIQKVEEATRSFMEKQDKAHDWYHIERVRDMALRIVEREGGDKELVELIALVHDVGDRKIHDSEEAGVDATVSLLEECGVPEDVAEKVTDLAHRVSFKGAGVPDNMPDLEGKIVQDADRLDAIGAIAIARTFTWGGHHNHPIYVPEEKVRMAQSAKDYYEKKEGSSINHFHEKLLLLKDRLHTKTAKEIGEKRHAFMEDFLEQFMNEWEGKD